MLQCRDTGIPLPYGAVALAPFLDLEGVRSKYETNAGKDKLSTPEPISFVIGFLLPEVSALGTHWLIRSTLT